MESLYSARWQRVDARAGEQTWLVKARQGEPWALERFYAEYHAPVYTLCYRMLGRQEDAEDAMQAAFIRAFRDLPRFRGDSALKTWLYRIAVNEALSLRRRRRDALPFEDQDASVNDDSELLIESLAVRRALHRLTAEQRAILVLQFWEGLTGPEIAEVLGLTLPAVKMRLYRARIEFRKQYEEER
jgi:RNA polymerase sigma-70 factor, ECF subfamily